MTSLTSICANWSPEKTECKKEGRATCKGCFLITYCSRTCQVTHWSEHRKDCKSFLKKETWHPAWILERRFPMLTQGGFEIYAKDLRLLFAASGDLRNVVKTVADLPTAYSGPLDITINDQDEDAVIRNVILLLVALVFDDPNEAIDCIIHLWYSALVRQSDIRVLSDRIWPLIQDVCHTTIDHERLEPVSKTWNFRACSLSVTLGRAVWSRLLSYCNIPSGLTAESAQKIRTGQVFGASEKDLHDEHMIFLSPRQRLAYHKFRQDGLLLPFGYPRHDFVQPNPTLFQYRGVWPLMARANPLSGWSLRDVLETRSGPATADVYGKLFRYLHKTLARFVERLSSTKIAFQFHQTTAAHLVEGLDKGSFDRIELSNLADNNHMGAYHTLSTMIPLLRPPQQNPHATLITLFTTAISSVTTLDEGLTSMFADPQTQELLRRYSPETERWSVFDAASLRKASALQLFAPVDRLFDRYLRTFAVLDAASRVGARIKEPHSIVAKWPYRMRLRPDQEGALQELRLCLREIRSSRERYVEWKRSV
ncbi:uncharacterized protein BO72DRAFT_476153 [Aspergillus fijiensis CBS 313.89]|uniref:MYND-type domain-containing protein n=1 Tax=Aspergillus fijiensis CBS 313.89 TaxID=1448319 RepID=A0A8G1RRT9_9EURO|nr:uncharacterized protein BO72DRAFT_476153 [Aspergillus fijiensis CBS 313.89]RAK79057.1 hypothetical protein BO72DRAFT_476153 [Aspergillus fijiensis CBS 313.89]